MSGPPTAQEVAESLKDLYRTELCLHYSAPAECSGPIIGAHTIQRAELDRIATNGRVYTLQIEPGAAIAGRPANPKLIPTSHASTVRAFCGPHDQQVFRAIEGPSYGGTPREVCLYGYRAVVFSSHYSLGERGAFNRLLAEDYSQTLEQHVERRGQLLRVGRVLDQRQQEVARMKTDFDTCLRADDFGRLRSYVVLLDRPPDVMCAFARRPIYDFNGQALPGASASQNAMLTITVTGTDTGGAIFFTWLDDSDANIQFVSSLDGMNDADLSSAVVRYALECSRNVFASPTWWDGLDGSAREQLLQRSMGQGPVGMTTAEYLQRQSSYHHQNDIRAAAWTTIAREPHF